ncbi:MipA/OmpV family protein [Inhella sp.]|uniref:MipA/OmpV family protein n=1 Tax=Inhella sp. TaxID=1921806 RepID=UPI0035B47DCA
MNTSFELLLGAAVLRGPAYLGSDERKSRALPQIAARWRNGWAVGLGGPGGAGGISYRFASDSAFSWGLRLGLDRGRDESDAEALRGMGDIKRRPEFGAFAGYALMPGLRVGASVRAGSGNDSNGVLVDLSVRGLLPVSQSVRLSASLTTTWANSQAMQSQFGVTADQSLSSGYALYTAGSGVRDVALQVGGTVSLRPDTSLFLGVTGRSLFGDAKDSPLVRQRTAASALASVAVRF